MSCTNNFASFHVTSCVPTSALKTRGCCKVDLLIIISSCTIYTTHACCALNDYKTEGFRPGKCTGSEQRVKMDSQPQRPVLTAIGVVVNIILLMVMITAIGFGIRHWSSCPVQPYIPIYLAVAGVSTTICIVLSYCITYSRMQGACSILCSALITVLYLFNFGWFISGTVWVFAIYPPHYLPSPGVVGYCQKTVYLFAFFLITLWWLIWIGMFFGAICFLFFVCAMSVKTHHLSRMYKYNAPYGATANVDPDSQPSNSA